MGYGRASETGIAVGREKRSATSAINVAKAPRLTGLYARIYAEVGVSAREAEGLGGLRYGAETCLCIPRDSAATRQTRTPGAPGNR